MVEEKKEVEVEREITPKYFEESIDGKITDVTKEEQKIF